MATVIRTDDRADSDADTKLDSEDDKDICQHAPLDEDPRSRRHGSDDAFDTPDGQRSPPCDFDHVREVLEAFQMAHGESTLETTADTTQAEVRDPEDGGVQISEGQPTTEDEDEEDLTTIPMPFSTPGPSTFAYERALSNRIKYPKLKRGGEYDMRAYTPTFVHDCLMMPGSLANIMGKRSAEDIINRMTPAILPGFHAHVHNITQQPCLLQSREPDDHLVGMMIFGQTKSSRNEIHKHYQPHSQRVKLQVEVDFLFLDEEIGQWVIRRKMIWACAWLWSNVRDSNVQFGGAYPQWTLQAYLSGSLSSWNGMKIGKHGFVGKDYEPDDDGDVDEAAEGRDNEQLAVGWA